MRTKESDLDKSKKEIREAEDKGLVWRSGNEFYVNYTNRGTTFGLPIETFGKERYVPDRTKLTYSLFMDDSERTRAKEILENCVKGYES